MKTHRLYAAGPLALGVTFALFLAMDALVGSNEELNLNETSPHRFIDYVQVETPISPKPIDRELVKPPEVEPIVDPDVPDINSDGPDDIFAIAPPRRGGEYKPDLDFFDGLSSDGELIPIVRVSPAYPTRAAERGIEGYVVVELTVAADGTVAEDSVIVVEAAPKGYFEREAIKAARKFKYKPKVIDGVAQPVAGVRYSFSFNLSN
ncbi:energy transducer TonB [Kordiimonas aquimaris]|uniref:energy transducer TonB n=1 Tax=Kordiimonas aquimaris TaxID=707591 RepID=UPI0021CFD31D|nr:energy transducer TonB [Kordiimonas aquimaris]